MTDAEKGLSRGPTQPEKRVKEIEINLGDDLTKFELADLEAWQAAHLRDGNARGSERYIIFSDVSAYINRLEMIKDGIGKRVKRAVVGQSFEFEEK